MRASILCLVLMLLPGAAGAQSAVTRERAETSALKLVPGGAIVNGNLERLKDRLLWSFDVSIPGSKNVRAIQIDARTGILVSNVVEGPTDR
jgi:uncharacterized membrane protein YkoI